MDRERLMEIIDSNGKEIGEFVCDKADTIYGTCLTEEEILSYKIESIDVDDYNQ